MAGHSPEGNPVVSKPRCLTALQMAPTVLRLLLRLRRLHPRSDLHALVEAATPSHTSLSDQPARAHAAAWLARTITRRFPRVFPQACLYWALAGYHFLRQAGEPAIIHFGLRKMETDLVSHAWLTRDGQPYFDDPEQHGFVETLSFPGGRHGEIRTPP